MVAPLIRIKLNRVYSGSVPVQVKNEQTSMPPKNNASSRRKYNMTAAVKRISILKDSLTLKLFCLFNFISHSPYGFYEPRIFRRFA